MYEMHPALFLKTGCDKWWQRKSTSKTTTQLPISRATKLFQATSPKGQRRQTLRRKVRGSTQKALLLILWRRQGPHYKNLPSYNSEAKGDCRSWSAAESAEASFTYCFILFSLCTRVRRQPTTFGLCYFGKSFSSFLGPAPITTTVTTHSYPKPAARRAPAHSTTARLSGRVRSLYNQ
jgi:hypothetical protein